MSFYEDILKLKCYKLNQSVKCVEMLVNPWETNFFIPLEKNSNYKKYTGCPIRKIIEDD